METTPTLGDDCLASHHRDLVRRAVQDTFAAFSGERPAGRTDTSYPMPFDGIVGVTSLVGDVAWSVMLGLPPHVAEAVARQFTGFDVDYGTEDMDDVVGELANILAGDIAAGLEAPGCTTNLSLPAVARGRDIALTVPEATLAATVWFTCSGGEFWLLVSATV